MGLQLFKLQSVQMNGKSKHVVNPLDIQKELLGHLYKAEPDRTWHINALNDIGASLPELHDQYKKQKALMDIVTQQQSRKFQPYTEEFNSSASSKESTPRNLEPLQEEQKQEQEEKFDIMNDIEHVDKLLDMFNSVTETDGFLRSLHRKGRRFIVAANIYLSSGWNIVDITNYSLFLFAFGIRVGALSSVFSIRKEVSDLDRDNPFSEHIDFYSVVFVLSLSVLINSINACLTWLKMFKYLQVFPRMALLTNTLSQAVKPLSVFIFIITIVLVGTSQGFAMAFGVDVRGYRNMLHALLSSLRMMVGDFDYPALEDSSPWLGPLLFWLYIFLVFFVLVSVFIALLSEAYDAARSRVPPVDPQGGSLFSKMGEEMMRASGGITEDIGGFSKVLSTRARNMTHLGKHAATNSFNSMRNVQQHMPNLTNMRRKASLGSNRITPLTEDIKNTTVTEEDLKNLDLHA